MNEPLVQSMTSQLIVRFRDRILSGAYAPGSALRQDSLAAEFGTSKIPGARGAGAAAIRRLGRHFPQSRFSGAAAGQRGTRRGLQFAAADRAERRGARRQAGGRRRSCRGDEALDRLNEATAAGEFGSSGQLNRAFHLLLIVPRLQPVAAEILSRLHTLAQRYVQAHLRPEGRANRATREHAALLRAWSAGKSREARALMHSHIKSTRDDLQERVR